MVPPPEKLKAVGEGFTVTTALPLISTLHAISGAVAVTVYVPAVAKLFHVIADPVP
jgi:hypothetical protein